MKKIIISLVLCVALITCMTGCSVKDYIVSLFSSETDKTYEKLESLSDLSYSEIKLEIVTATDDVELKATYTLTESKVAYMVEKLNTLSPDANLSELSPEYKTTYKGSAKIVDGKISELDGDSVSLPSYDELTGNFNFDKNNFDNVEIEYNSLSADVVDPSAFYGAELVLENMKLEVEYTEDALSKITVTYQTQISTVKASYEFVK